MNIFVTLKRLPDSETKVKVSGDGKTLDKTDVKFIVNPYDENALEQAVVLNQKHGGETTIINVDTELFTKEIRTGLAMGIEKAIFIKIAENADNFAVAKSIADALKDKNMDMLLLGKQAIDDDSHAIGQIVATMLNVPCVSDISSLEIEGNKAKIKRAIEGGDEIIEIELPAVFTCDKSLNNPRLPSFMGIKKAKQKEIVEINAEATESTLKIEKMVLPPQRTAGLFIGEGVDAIPELIKRLKEEAKVL